MANGLGVYQDHQNYKYEGQWKDDCQEGQGVETWESEGNKFSGNFEKNQKQGPGRFDWREGSYYQGGFVDGVFHGYGEYYFAE